MVDVKNSSSQLYKYRKIDALRTQRKYYQVSLLDVSPIQGVDLPLLFLAHSPQLHGLAQVGQVGSPPE